jgi:hypothetical protein
MDKLDTLMETIPSYRFRFGDDEKERSGGEALPIAHHVGQHERSAEVGQAVTGERDQRRRGGTGPA